MNHDFQAIVSLPYLINVLSTLMPDISTLITNIYIYIYENTKNDLILLNRTRLHFLRNLCQMCLVTFSKDAKILPSIFLSYVKLKVL